MTFFLPSSTCVALRDFTPASRFAHQYSESPKGKEAPSGKPKEGAEQSEQLDDAKSEKNKKLWQKFIVDFADKMKGGRLTLTQNVNGVEWKYVFEDQGDGTVRIAKRNESEAQENKDKGDAPPKPVVRTVTYARFYADKIVGMAGVARLLEDNKTKAEEEHETPASEEPEEKPKKKGGVAVEAKVQIPKESTKASPEETKDSSEYGGELTAEYVSGSSSKPHIAYTLTLSGGNKYSVTTPTSGELVLADKDTYSGRVRLGLRGVLPLGPVALYGGVGAGAGVDYIQTSTITGGVNPVIDESSNMKVSGGLTGTAGARLQLGRWRVLGEVQKGTEGKKPKVYLGLGYQFE